MFCICVYKIYEIKIVPQKYTDEKITNNRIMLQSKSISLTVEIAF